MNMNWWHKMNMNWWRRICLRKASVKLADALTLLSDIDYPCSDLERLYRRVMADLKGLE